MREREKRNSGIEALRIIAMLMIIAYHYLVHGKAIETGGTKIFLECASLWGKAGVNLFCLIMGYFGIQSKFKVKKYSKWRHRWYSILCSDYSLPYCLNVG